MLKLLLFVLATGTTDAVAVAANAEVLLALTMGWLLVAVMMPVENVEEPVELAVELLVVVMVELSGVELSGVELESVEPDDDEDEDEDEDGAADDNANDDDVVEATMLGPVGTTTCVAVIVGCVFGSAETCPAHILYALRPTEAAASSPVQRPAFVDPAIHERAPSPIVKSDAEL